MPFAWLCNLKINIIRQFKIHVVKAYEMNTT
jgi:hypothetical protein